MHSLNTVRDVNVYFGLTLQLVIAAVMLIRRLYGQSRYFFIYILWQTLSTIALYGSYRLGHPAWFWYGVWVNNAITITLGFIIISEIFSRFFAPYQAIRSFAKTSLLISAAVLIVVSSIVATFHQVAYSTRLLTLLLVLQRSLRIVQLGLILALFALSRYLHLRWRNVHFGIALGFGFYAVLELASVTARMYYGKSIAAITDVFLGTAYCAAALIWTIYVSQPDAATIPIASLPSHQLEEWDEILRKTLSFKNASGSRKPPTFDDSSESDEESVNDNDKVAR